MAQSNKSNIDNLLKLPELLEEENNLLNNQQFLFPINQSQLIQIDAENIKQEYVDQNSSGSANVIFAQAIQKQYGTSLFPASSSVVFTNILSSPSSATVTSVYEHIRGYVYRDNTNWGSYITGSNSSYVISKNALTNPPCINNIGGLSGIRVVLFNRKLFKDAIMPSTLRMNISPINTNFNIPPGLNFNNATVVDGASGNFASITGAAGLSGSLSSGVNAKAVTGFTIAIIFKPANSGPTIQTLFHRRIAHPSLSALNYAVANPGINNTIVTQPYSTLNPLSAVQVLVAGTSTYTGSIGVGVDNGMSGIWNLINVGGGQLNWSASSQTSWLSISSAMTGNTIYGITNLLSTTAAITAYLNNSITGLPPNMYNGSFVIYNSTTSLQKCHNLPIIVPVTLTLRIY